jgi:predicted DNA-binding protein with PD1-like motif
MKRLLVLLLLATNALAQSRMETSPMTTVALRLGPGQDLKKELDAFVKRHHLAAVSVLTCVGSLTRVPLRYANQEGYEVLTGHFEIVSLTGMLSAQSGSHLHLSVSDSTGRTVGGHFGEGSAVYTTAEVLLGVLSEYQFTREPDPQSGYRELVIRKKER